MKGEEAIVRSTEHESFVLERRYPVPPGRVFAAWADPAARLHWSAPSPDQGVEYLETDFQVGGCDVSRCGPVGDLCIRVEARYHDIVADRRIVFAESVSHDGTLLSVSLITVVFAGEGSGTRLTLTDQIVALDGAEMVAGSKAGLGAALQNLDGYLRRAPL